MAEEWNVKEFRRYRNFIVRLRKRLRCSRESFGVPHLIPQQSTPTQFFDFTLRTSNHRVTFRLRRDNLYLIGYQMENGQWLEFGRDGDRHLIPGANFLGFDGSYHTMARAAGRQTVQGLQVGSSSLETAVGDLATTDAYGTRAQRLIVVIMTICEAVRLDPILDAVSNGEASIEGWMMDAVRNWGNYSEVLCRIDADPTDFSFRESDLRLPPDNRPVSDTSQVAQILGIILSYCYAPSPRRLPRMILDDDDDDDDDQYCFEGRPLVEVFSVHIDNNDNEDPGKLYGTIAVNDGLTQYIYNRPSSYAESISPGQNVTIIGPHRSIWAQRSFTIQFLLTDSDPWRSPDDEVVNDSISWDALDFSNTTMYDKPISQQVKGKYGSATVNYAVLRNAATALVTINLQEGGEDTVEVYGNVVANYSDWNYPNTTSLLFNRPKDDYLEVRRWQNIPLLKSIVAVPLGSSLKITANLYDYDPVTPDDKIAIGTVEFPADTSGQSSKDIIGEDGNRVKVTVSWGEALAPDGDRGYSLRPPHDEL